VQGKAIHQQAAGSDRRQRINRTRSMCWVDDGRTLQRLRPPPLLRVSRPRVLDDDDDDGSYRRSTNGNEFGSCFMQSSSGSDEGGRRHNRRSNSWGRRAGQQEIWNYFLGVRGIWMGRKRAGYVLANKLKEIRMGSNHDDDADATRKTFASKTWCVF